MVFGRSEAWFWRFVGILAISVCSLNVMVLLSGKEQKREAVQQILLVKSPPTTSKPIVMKLKDDNAEEHSVADESKETEAKDTNLLTGLENKPGIPKRSITGADKAEITKSLKNPMWLPIRQLDKYFQPSKILSLGKKRDNKGYVVIGIPTVYRKKAYYLLDTVKWLVQNLSEEERHEVVIVIFVADFNQEYREKVIKGIKEKFISEVNSGLIQVIIAPNDYYPSMDKLPLLYGDKPDRVQWRSKQSLDYSFLYYYCADLAEYYIQLEDDVLTDKNYLSRIKGFINKKSDDWSILEFGARGFIGMTYRTKHLKMLARFSRFYFWTMPIDWIFRIFNDIYLYGNRKTNVLRPPVFKHVGEYSSLDGQLRKLEDMRHGKTEQLKPVYQVADGNPKAHVTSSIEEYVVPHHIEQAYVINGMFWGKAVKEDDYLEVIFDTTQNLERIVILSGSPRYPSDSIENSELYFSNNYDGKSCLNYELVSKFTDLPLIDHSANPVKRVKCIKLVLTSIRLDDHKRRRWLIIREIAIFSKG